MPMRNDMPMYDAKVIDNYGNIVCRRTNVDWIRAVNWCMVAANDWGFSSGIKNQLVENGEVILFHEEISEIRIDKHK